MHSSRSMLKKIIVPFIVLFAAIATYWLLQSKAAIVPVPATRDVTVWPFSSTSPWNMPIGSGAQYSSATDPRVNSILASGTGINAGQYSHPIYMATTADPIATVHATNTGQDVRYRIPSNATAAGGSDRHLHVIDPTKHWVDECWNAQGGGTYWTCGYAKYDLYGSGVLGPDGTRAYGGSAIGGLIRKWDIAQGVIRHAIPIMLDTPQLKQGFVWPASNQDGDAAYSGNVPMGSLFAIRPDVVLENLGLTPDGLMLARAFQDYGGYVVDRAPGFILSADVSLEGSSQLANMRNDLTKIRAQLRAVTNNSATNIGGGGTTRRQPLAPEVGGTTITPTATATPTATSTPVPNQVSQTNNLISGKIVTVSSSEPGFPSNNLNDKVETTRWISAPGAMNSTVTADLGANYTLTKVSMLWAADTTKNFKVQISTDNSTWTTIYSGVTNNTASQLIVPTSFAAPAQGRYVRITGIDLWNSSFGHSLYELGAYGSLTPVIKAGDVNGDSKVNITDLSIVITNFNTIGARSLGDVSGDGKIDITDMSVVITKWGS